MNVKKLFQAVQHTGEPPCTVFHCPKRQTCAETKSACTAFYLYVLTGRCHEPTMELTERKPFWLRGPMPTRAKFDETMRLDAV